MASRVGLSTGRGGLEQGSKARQQGCIEPIGFGELTQGLSEAAGVAGIDLRQRQAGGRKTPLQHAVIRAGWLEDHALDSMAGEPGDEGAMAFGVIGEVARGPIGVKADIEAIFGNVDAGGLWYRMIHLFRVLGLSCGPSRPGIRSGHEEKRGAVRL
jgi:hypothetical protein